MYRLIFNTPPPPPTHTHTHTHTQTHTWMQNKKQQPSSFIQAWRSYLMFLTRKKERKMQVNLPLSHTQNSKHTSFTPLQSYQQSKISLTLQLNTTYHHRSALSVVIYTPRLRGGGREDNGEPICVYGFAGKEINDLPFLFGFNEEGTEGLPSIPISLLSSSSIHRLPPVFDLVAGRLTKDIGQKRNSPLSKCKV